MIHATLISMTLIRLRHADAAVTRKIADGCRYDAAADTRIRDAEYASDAACCYDALLPLPPLMPRYEMLLIR